MPASYELDISEDLKAAFERRILVQMVDAVATSSERDAMCQDFVELLEGLSPMQTAARWNDSCSLDYPLVRDAHLTLQAQYVASVKRDPLIMVEATDPDDDEDATAQESFLSAIGPQIHLRERLTDVADFCLKYPTALLYAGWASKTRLRHQTLTLGESGYGGEEGFGRESGAREIELLMSEVEEDGAELRAVDTTDFYLYPARARSIDCALGVGERMWLTGHDLLQGIEDYGYEEEAVMDLLSRGPQIPLGQPNTSPQRELDDTLGLSDPSEAGDNLYEIFLWFTRPPLIMEDGELVTPRHLLDADLMVVACPACHTILKMTRSPYQHKRPYIAFRMLERAGDFYGICLPLLLDALAQEANATLRHFIDCLNLDINPVFKVKQTAQQLNDSFQSYPGAYFFVTDPSDITPLEKPLLNQMPMELLGLIDSKAQGLYASSGFGQMQQKVRKNQEVRNVQMAAASKFDLILYFFLKGVEELAAHLIWLYATFAGDDIDFLDDTRHRRTIRPQQLKGKFLYHATATGQYADPMARSEAAMARQQIAEKYWGLSGQMPPEKLKFLWSAYRKTLIDMDTPRPEEFIGPEPESPPARVAPGLPGLSGAAASGPGGMPGGPGAGPMGGVASGGMASPGGGVPMNAVGNSAPQSMPVPSGGNGRGP